MAPLEDLKNSIVTNIILNSNRVCSTTKQYISYFLYSGVNMATGSKATSNMSLVKAPRVLVSWNKKNIRQVCAFCVHEDLDLCNYCFLLLK